MYEDEKYSINWLKIILRVLIAFLVILITIKLIMMISHNRKQDANTNEYAKQENLKLMDNYAKDTYTKEKAPTVVGSSINESLKVIIDNGGLKELEGLADHCDMDNSYIEVVRLDDELQYTSYLTCNEGKEKDSVVSLVPLEEKKTTTKNGKTTTAKTNKTTKVTTSKEKTTTKKVSTTKKTTNKTTKKTTKKTTSKKYTVSFNPNGGSFVNDIKVNPGSTVKLPTPTRSGYKFVGWYSHGNRVSSNTKVNSNMVLVARWELA